MEEELIAKNQLEEENQRLRDEIRGETFKALVSLGGE